MKTGWQVVRSVGRPVDIHRKLKVVNVYDNRKTCMGVYGGIYGEWSPIMHLTLEMNFYILVYMKSFMKLRQCSKALRALLFLLGNPRALKKTPHFIWH